MVNKKKLVLLVVLLVFLLAALGIALVLVLQRQEIRRRAEGQPTISLSPSQEQIEIYSGLPLEIKFNTNNLSISKIAVRLTYLYQEDDPQIKFDISRSSFSSALLSAGWSCPVMNNSFETGSIPKKGILDLECNHETVYFNSSESLLAAVLMRSYDMPLINPVELNFDSASSYVVNQASGEQVSFQILAQGVYEVVTCIGCTPTPEPPTTTPTQAPTSPPPPPGSTSTPTPTTSGGGGQSGLTSTPTSTVTPTPITLGGTTPTPTLTGGTGSGSTQSGSLDEIPVTAVSLPTLSFLAIGGVIFLFGFLLLI